MLRCNSGTKVVGVTNSYDRIEGPLCEMEPCLALLREPRTRDQIRNAHTIVLLKEWTIK